MVNVAGSVSASSIVLISFFCCSTVNVTVIFVVVMAWDCDPRLLCSLSVAGGAYLASISGGPAHPKATVTDPELPFGGCLARGVGISLTQHNFDANSLPFMSYKSLLSYTKGADGRPLKYVEVVSVSPSEVTT